MAVSVLIVFFLNFIFLNFMLWFHMVESAGYHILLKHLLISDAEMNIMEPL